MRETKGFIINGREFKLPLLQKGDRVKIDSSDTFGDETVEGTVFRVEQGGIIVSVRWDKEKYYDEDRRRTVTYGSKN